MGRRKEDANSFDNSQDNRLHKDCWTERTLPEETHSNNEVVLAARARFLRRRHHRREERTSDVATNCMRFTPKNKVVKVPSVLSSKQQGDNDVEVTRVVRRPPRSRVASCHCEGYNPIGLGCNCNLNNEVFNSLSGSDTRNELLDRAQADDENADNETVFETISYVQTVQPAVKSVQPAIKSVQSVQKRRPSVTFKIYNEGSCTPKPSGRKMSSKERYTPLHEVPSSSRTSLETVLRPRLGSGNIVNTTTKTGNNVKSVKKGAKDLSCCMTPISDNVQVWAESPALGRSDLAVRSSSRRRRNRLVHTTMSPVLQDKLFRC